MTIYKEFWYREAISTRQKAISEVAEEVRNDFGMSPCKISRGWCGDYATIVWEKLRERYPEIVKDVEIRWDDDFRVIKNTGHDTPRGPWDREALRELGVTSPLQGQTWESLQSITPGIHIFLVDTIDQRFYDSDVPQGVKSLFDLPLLQEHFEDPR